MLMFKALCAVAAFVSFACAAPTAAQALTPRAVRVAPDTYMVQGVSALGSSANRNFISNAAFVVTPEGVLVVDALGSPTLALELLAEIRRITPAPVRLKALKEAGATVIVQ